MTNVFANVDWLAVSSHYHSHDVCHAMHTRDQDGFTNQFLIEPNLVSLLLCLTFALSSLHSPAVSGRSHAPRGGTLRFWDLPTAGR